jgi:peroxiredoxin
VSANCEKTRTLVWTFPEDLKQVYLQMGIDVGEYNGDGSWRLPMPSRFIVDQDRIIRYAHVSADHTVRADPPHTLEALKEVVEKRGRA